MIQKISRLCLFSLFFLCAVAGHVSAHDDISAQRSCSQCGMDRKAYGYSRMLIQYADGSSAGVCSLHCAVTEMKTHQEKKVASLLVADRNSHELIPAEKAFWTIGGSKRGVMTPVAKWAFAGRDAAENFTATYGGTVVTWEAALAAAGKDAAP